MSNLFTHEEQTEAFETTQCETSLIVKMKKVLRKLIINILHTINKTIVKKFLFIWNQKIDKPVHLIYCRDERTKKAYNHNKVAEKSFNTF